MVPSASDPLVEPDVALVLEDAHGVEVARGIAGRDSRELIRDTLAAGTYYVRVEAQQAQSVTYTLTGRTLSPSEVAVSDAVAHESEDTTVRFRVALNEAAPNEVTVRYETVDGTAVAGEDYESVSDVLTFAVGETEKWVEVALIDDTVEDAGETFGLRLSEVTGAVLGDAEAVGTILDSDTPMNVPEPAGEDFAADATTAGRVLVGESVTGDIATAGDVDWFAVELEAGRAYRLDLEGSATRAGTLSDPYLRGIHDDGGTLIAGTASDNGGRGRNGRVEFTATEAGTYYVAAGASGDLTGTYKLSVRDRGVDDFSAGPSTIGAVEVGGSATGEAQLLADRDWFAVTLQAGLTYRFDLEGSRTGAGTMHNPMLHGIHDADGTLIRGTTDDDGGVGTNSRVEFQPAHTGIYYAAAGATGLTDRGTYTLSVTASTEDDFAAGPGTIGVVSVGGSAAGVINGRSDIDWFAVTLEGGKRYVIDLEGADTNAGTLRYPYLHGVYADSDTLLPRTTDYGSGTGSNSQVRFRVQESGTYYVAVRGLTGHRESGTYTLSVDLADGEEAEEPVTDDHAASGQTTGTVSVDGAATGEIEVAYDRDWFAVTLEAGKVYRIDLEGAATGAGTLSDPYLHGVFDDRGVLIRGTSSDGGGNGRDSRSFFTPTEAGTYYLAAGASGDLTGTYRLSVTDVDDYAAAPATTGAVTVGGSATGEIGTPGDHDWFAVTLEARKVYRIDLEGVATGAGTLSDPYLRGVYNADGAPIAGTSNDNGGTVGNSREFFTSAEAGTYYVAAGADGNLTGTYRLSVTDADDYAAAPATTGAVTVGGSATGEIGTPGDHDWFAVTLEAAGSYAIDLEGSDTLAATLRDPKLYGIHDSDGNPIAGTNNDDGGTGRNGRVVFTAPDAGTYYVAAGAGPGMEGTYTLSVTSLPSDPDSVRAGAFELWSSPHTGGVAHRTLDGAGDAVDYYRFELSGTRRVWFALYTAESTGGTEQPDTELVLEDAQGNELMRGAVGDSSDVIDHTLAAGEYFVRVEAPRAGDVSYVLYGTERGPVEIRVSDAVAHEGFAPAVRFTITLDQPAPYPVTVRYETVAATAVAGEDYETASGELTFAVGDRAKSVDVPLIDDDVEDSGETFAFRLSGARGAVLGDAEAVGTILNTEMPPSMSEPVGTDFPANTTTEGRVTAGESVTGGLEYDFDAHHWNYRDADWFAVRMVSGRTYRMEVRADDCDPLLGGLYDENGSYIGGTSSNNGGPRVPREVSFFRAWETGDYYVKVEGLWRETGTYTLSVTDVTDGNSTDSPRWSSDDFPAWIDTAGVVVLRYSNEDEGEEPELPPGHVETYVYSGSARGVIEAVGDRDWFAVSMEAGHTYRIYQKGVFTWDGTLFDPHLRGIYDADGNFIEGTAPRYGEYVREDGHDLPTGHFAKLDFTPREAGTYYVAAGADGVALAIKGAPATYTLYVVDLTKSTGSFPEDEFAAGPDTTGAVAVGWDVRSSIDYDGDVDWFAVELREGTRYRIDIEAKPGVTGWLGWPFLDPVLHGIHDEHGNLIPGTTNDQYSNAHYNARVHFVVPANPDGDPSEARTFYIAAGGDASNGASNYGPYTLKVRESPDDFTNGPSRPGLLSIGGSTTGEIEFASDIDWFAVAMNAGSTYRFDLTTGSTWRFDLGGLTRGDGTLPDPYLHGIYDADRNLLPGTIDDDGGEGSNSRVQFTAPADGTYYVAAGGADPTRNWPPEEGTYTLSATEIDAI